MSLPSPPDHLVVADAAVEQVVAAVAGEDVVTAVAEQHVGLAAAEQVVLASGADHQRAGVGTGRTDLADAIAIVVVIGVEADRVVAGKHEPAVGVVAEVDQLDRGGRTVELVTHGDRLPVEAESQVAVRLALGREPGQRGGRRALGDGDAIRAAGIGDDIVAVGQSEAVGVVAEPAVEQVAALGGDHQVVDDDGIVPLLLFVPLTTKRMAAFDGERADEADAERALAGSAIDGLDRRERRAVGGELHLDGFAAIEAIFIIRVAENGRARPAQVERTLDLRTPVPRIVVVVAEDEPAALDADLPAGDDVAGRRRRRSPSSRR